MKKIALIAPSSPAKDLTPETIDIIREKLTNANYKSHLTSHTLDEMRYLAGSDEDRAQDIMRAFTDDNIDIIMTIRGGYGSPRLLDKLDYDIIRKNPKPFWTISDGTALQTALYTCAGISGYSGLQGLFFLNDKNEKLIQTALGALNDNLPDIPVQKVWTSGTAQGIMLGGNLSVFTGLLGTPYFPDMTDKILVIEDVNEQPYQVDRMLTQLRLAGIFDKLAGIVLGDFSHCLSKDASDGTIEDVFTDFFTNFHVPVVQINYGHLNRETVVPIGKSVQINNHFVKEI